MALNEAAKQSPSRAIIINPFLQAMLRHRSMRLRGMQLGDRAVDARATLPGGGIFRPDS